MSCRRLPLLASVVATAALGPGCTDDYGAFLGAAGTASTTGGTAGATGAGAGGDGTGAEGAATSTGGAGAGASGGGGAGVGGAGVGGAGVGGAGGTVACGNGSIDPGEECDGGPGALGCDASCQVKCDGPGEVEDPATRHCYYRDIEDTERAWDDARAFCQAWGGDLLVLEAMSEYTTLLATLPIPASADFYWAGATDPSSSGTFTWIDGQALTYPWNAPPWMNDQPNFNGDCLCWKASSSAADEGICDLPCTEPHHPFCERLPPGS